MEKKTWITLTLAALLLCSLLAGCANSPTKASKDEDNSQMANPWVDATNEQAAAVLSGKMYGLTTLDKSYERYALMVTTKDSVEKTGIKPTAWARYRKGDEDVSLQMQKGGKLDAEQLKGKPIKVNEADAYIISSGDGTTQIAWESEGLLMEISTSNVWEDGALVGLAEGVKTIN